MLRALASRHLTLSRVQLGFETAQHMASSGRLSIMHCLCDIELPYIQPHEMPKNFDMVLMLPDLTS